MNQSDVMSMAQHLGSDFPEDADEDADMEAILPWLKVHYPDATPHDLLRTVEMMDAMDRLEAIKEART